MMTSRAILKDEDPRGWAISAAKQDASYLISPRARESAINILMKSEQDDETRAALVILMDGGAQQGPRQTGNIYRASSFEAWKLAADLLGVFDND